MSASRQTSNFNNWLVECARHARWMDFVMHFIKVDFLHVAWCRRAHKPGVSDGYRPCRSLETEDPENRKPSRRGERWHTSPDVKQRDRWSVNTAMTLFSFLQRKGVGQSNHQERGCWAYCKYHPQRLLFIYLTKNNTLMPFVVVGQMSEMEISRSVAERSLREHLGNVVEALVALTN